MTSQIVQKQSGAKQAEDYVPQPDDEAEQEHCHDWQQVVCPFERVSLRESEGGHTEGQNTKTCQKFQQTNHGNRRGCSRGAEQMALNQELYRQGFTAEMRPGSEITHGVGGSAIGAQGQQSDPLVQHS